MDSIDELLTNAQTIAVVGLSDDPARPSHGVAAYLRDAGYHVIPVNPNIAEWEGVPSVAALDDIEEPVDVVNIFRRPEHVPELVDAAIRIGATAVWMQLGIKHPEAARKAEDAELVVVQDKCIAVEHKNRLEAHRVSEEGAW